MAAHVLRGVCVASSLAFATCCKVLLNSAGNAANTIFGPHKRKSCVQMKCGPLRRGSPHVYRGSMQPLDWQPKCCKRQAKLKAVDFSPCTHAFLADAGSNQCHHDPNRNLTCQTGDFLTRSTPLDTPDCTACTAVCFAFALDGLLFTAIKSVLYLISLIMNRRFSTSEPPMSHGAFLNGLCTWSDGTLDLRAAHRPIRAIYT